MSGEDPIDGLVRQLEDEPLDEELRQRVGLQAQRIFEREASRFARFDRWALGRIAPAMLVLSALAFTFDLVRYFERVYLGERPEAQAGAALSPPQARGVVPADAALRTRASGPQGRFTRAGALGLEDPCRDAVAALGDAALGVALDHEVAGAGDSAGSPGSSSIQPLMIYGQTSRLMKAGRRLVGMRNVRPQLGAAIAYAGVASLTFFSRR